MRIDKVYIKKFKNLSEFNIDIDESQWENVFLGKNATGKSNFFEALVLIFKNLDIHIKEAPPFEFNIFYTCKGKRVNIYVKDGKYHFTTWGKFEKGKWVSLMEFSRAEFERRKEEYLPNHVFIYYSGTSERLQNVYIEHQKKYYLEIIKSEAKKRKVNTLRRIFLVQNIHSKFALLAFFIFEDKHEKTLEFLRNELGIVDLHSLLLVLRKPIWSKTSSSKEMFWKSGGLVRSFLEQLWEFSLAPIYNTETVPVSYKSSQSQERLYLFVQNKEKIGELAKKHYDNRTQFFNALESTYISDLIEDIKVRVEKKTSSEKIPFSEMSEGEQQLLTVLGMLRFIKDKESLILLDEPDTHLNPLWKWKYLEYFREYVARDETTQIFISTHDPLVIGGLSKEQIRIFKNDAKGRVKAEMPDIDPKGLGVAGILTSELFGLSTTLDKETQEKLNRKRFLQGKLKRESLNNAEEKEFKKLRETLDSLGFYDKTNDELYNRFLEEVSANELFQKVEFTDAEKIQVEQESKKIIEMILKEQSKK